MNQHKIDILVARVAQNVFQIQRMAVAQAEVVADADSAVKMHGEMQLSGLIDQHAKNVILESAVVVLRGYAASAVLGINGFCFFTRRIPEKKRAEISGFKLHGHAAFFLIVGERLADESLVAGQIGGQANRVFLFHVTLKNFFLERDVNGHVTVPGDQALVIKRKKERIDEEYPVKALGV